MNTQAGRNAATIRQRVLQAGLLATVMAAGIWWWKQPPAFTDACQAINDKLAICAASNMARFHETGPITLDHADFDLQQGAVQLHMARNESLGFQLVLRNVSGTPVDVSVTQTGWKQATTAADSLEPPLSTESMPQTELLLAHYHYVNNGGYTWGPKSDVLEWPANYPDALVPQMHRCGGTERQLFRSIPVPPGKNRALWFDTFVPVEAPAGRYSKTITLTTGDTGSTEVDVDLSVVDALLPNKPSIAAVGELYRTYKLEGAGIDRQSPQWQTMSRCYQQIAHQHRMVFIERTPVLLEDNALQQYADFYEPALTGTLFTGQFGYTGTGMNTPVSVWRTPWPQEFNVKLDAPLSDDVLARYTELSRQWYRLAAERKWNDVDFFAYVFDELDGPMSANVSANEQQQHDHYIGMVHKQMDLLQQAIDAGSETQTLDLLWTSHSNPADWVGKPTMDLTGKVRLWAPNASAADPAFLAQRMSEGDTAWFYHSGHPAVGTHSINSSGIEMRTWGVIGARYGLHGQLMWAVNLGNDDKPFARPNYKDGEDRFGNGVMVYPGNQLDKIGYKKAPGPLPSMRLKAWRRGLQDAELYLLARSNEPEESDALLAGIMPVALADAQVEAAWSQKPSDWIDFRKVLLKIAAGN